MLGDSDELDLTVDTADLADVTNLRERIDDLPTLAASSNYDTLDVEPDFSALGKSGAFTVAVAAGTLLLAVLFGLLVAAVLWVAFGM